MARGKARPSTRYILPNNVYVIIYDDVPEMKIGFKDRDFEIIDNSSWTDGSRLILTVQSRGENPRNPTPRGRDVVVRRPDPFVPEPTEDPDDT